MFSDGLYPSRYAVLPVHSHRNRIVQFIFSDKTSRVVAVTSDEADTDHKAALIAFKSLSNADTYTVISNTTSPVEFPPIRKIKVETDTPENRQAFGIDSRAYDREICRKEYVDSWYDLQKVSAAA